MNISTTYMQKLSQCMFWLLFPGLFFYSSGVGLGVIPAFLGGGVGVLIAIAFIILFPAALFTSLKLEGTPLIYFCLFIGLLLYTLSYLVFHNFFDIRLHTYTIHLLEKGCIIVFLSILISLLIRVI